MFFKSIFVAIVFFILTPGILLRLPSKGSVKVVALVHALIFSFIVSISYNMIDSLDSNNIKKEKFATKRNWCLAQNYTWDSNSGVCYNGNLPVKYDDIEYDE